MVQDKLLPPCKGPITSSFVDAWKRHPSIAFFHIGANDLHDICTMALLYGALPKVILHNLHFMGIPKHVHCRYHKSDAGMSSMQCRLCWLGERLRQENRVHDILYKFSAFFVCGEHWHITSL